MKKWLFALVCVLSATFAAKAADFNEDWARFGRYAKANAELTKSPDVVFMGNSITDAWPMMMPDFWAAHPGFAGRGIAGQTSSEMLVRFRQDVIDLHPKVVAILAGINDIAHNNGAISLEHVMGNIQSMVELARANKIKVAICSVVPCDFLAWRSQLTPADDVRKLNAMIKEYVKAKKDKNVIYVDYYSAMANEKGGLDKELSEDGCHPTKAGYAIMQDVITKALKRWVK